MIIPSIDLMDGKAVQLKQGKEKILERDDVFQLAKAFSRFGEIAVIDLDAAMGKGSNLSLIKRLASEYPIRVGGGIRSVELALDILRSGAEKIIIGSSAFTDSGLNRDFLDKLKERAGKQYLVIAMDVYDEKIMIKGWKETTRLSIWEVLPGIETYATEILVTDVSREGTMTGINKEFYDRLGAATPVKITAAGGVGNTEDIHYFARKGMNVQLGMSLYTGKIPIDEAFISGIHFKESLIPTVVRDTSGRVLMVAYSSKESLKKSIETGQMWYFSRSRQKLWQKGETSGHVQEIVNFRLDCDNDTLLVTVKQKEVACHTGKYSCFDEKAFILEDLYDIIFTRFKNPVQSSYTATLTPDKTAQKILEEANEVVNFTDRDNLIWEIADLLYFISVYMVQHEIQWKDVLLELRRRRFK